MPKNADLTVTMPVKLKELARKSSHAACPESPSRQRNLGAMGRLDESFRRSGFSPT